MLLCSPAHIVVYMHIWQRLCLCSGSLYSAHRWIANVNYLRKICFQLLHHGTVTVTVTVTPTTGSGTAGSIDAMTMALWGWPKQFRSDATITTPTKVGKWWTRANRNCCSHPLHSLYVGLSTVVVVMVLLLLRSSTCSNSNYPSRKFNNIVVLM